MNARAIRLAVLAFVLGVAATMAIGYGLRFTVLSIQHGGLF